MNINLSMRKETRKHAFVLVNSLLLITMLIGLALFKLQLIQIEASNVHLAKAVGEDLVFKREVFEELYRKLEDEKWEDVIKATYSFEKIGECNVLVKISDEKFIIYHKFEAEKK